MVFCEDVRTSGVPIQVLQISSTILYCDRKFFEIDKTYCDTFDLDSVRMVNPHEDSLYVMFYVEQDEDDFDEYEDGPVSEAVHLRWKPTLTELIDSIQHISQQGCTAFELVMSPYLCVAKEAVLPKGTVHHLICNETDDKKNHTELKKRKEPAEEDNIQQTERLARVLEAAMVNAVELMDLMTSSSSKRRVLIQ